MRKSKIDKRREHVKEIVNNAAKPTKAVQDLADRLFLSEQTIWNDLKH